jgi:predicted metal-dependent HD superfamily phosphohydrolase
MADALRHHHAWVRVENGNVHRAYAWVNETAWNQGPKTLAEIELNMKCFNYGEASEWAYQTTEESAAANVDKVPALAARWSIDPAAFNSDGRVPADGVAAKSSRFHQD